MSLKSIVSDTYDVKRNTLTDLTINTLTQNNSNVFKSLNLGDDCIITQGGHEIHPDNFEYLASINQFLGTTDQPEFKRIQAESVETPAGIGSGLKFGKGYLKDTILPDDSHLLQLINESELGDDNAFQIETNLKLCVLADGSKWENNLGENSTFKLVNGLEVTTPDNTEDDTYTINFIVSNKSGSNLGNIETYFNVVPDPTTQIVEIKTYTAGDTSCPINFNCSELQINGEVVNSGSDPTFDSITVNNDVTIGGNLTVNGTATYINTTNLEVKDSLIHLANENIADTVDQGLFGQYDSGSGLQYWSFYRDANDSGIFKIQNNIPTEPTTVIPAGGTDGTLLLAGLKIGANTLTDLQYLTNINQQLSTLDVPLFPSINVGTAGDFATLTKSLITNVANAIVAESYTPTTTAVSNISSISNVNFVEYSIGALTKITGRFTCIASTGGTIYIMRFSLPVGKNVVSTTSPIFIIGSARRTTSPNFTGTLQIAQQSTTELNMTITMGTSISSFDEISVIFEVDYIDA